MANQSPDMLGSLRPKPTRRFIVTRQQPLHTQDSNNSELSPQRPQTAAKTSKNTVLKLNSRLDEDDSYLQFNPYLPVMSEKHDNTKFVQQLLNKSLKDNSIRRKICGPVEIFNEMMKEKSQEKQQLLCMPTQQSYQIQRTLGKPKDGRSVTHTYGRSIQITTNVSNNSSSRAKLQKISKIKINSSELNSQIQRIKQRIEENRSSEVKDLKIDQIRSQMQQYPILIIDKAPLTQKNWPTQGALINELSQEKKLNTYSKFKEYWEKSKAFSSRYMAYRRQQEGKKDFQSQRISVMDKNDQYLEKKQEIKSLERCVFQNQPRISDNIWYESLRQPNLPIKGRQKSEKFTPEKTRRFNPVGGDLHGQCDQSLVKEDELTIVVHPEEEMQSFWPYQTNVSRSSVTPGPKSEYLKQKQKANSIYLKNQFHGSTGFEELKGIRLLGQSQLAREIDACQKIRESDLVYHINAHKRNEKTGEEDTEQKQETIESNFENKKLFY